MPLSQSSPVAYLVPEFPAWYAPAIETEIALLRARGIEIVVIALDQPRRATRWAPIAGAADAMRGVAAHLAMLRDDRASYIRGLSSALRYAAIDGQSVRARMAWLWRFARAICIGSRLRRRGISSCHAHFTTNLAVLIADAFGVETSLTLHGPGDFAGIPAAVIRSKVASSVFTRTVSLDGMRHVLACCAANDQQRVIYVPLGVDTNRWKREWRPAAGRTRIVCVARLQPVKGHDILLRAFSRVVMEDRSMELLLIGDGPCRGAIERQIRELGLEPQVTCTGVIPNTALTSIVHSADVFVLASHAEGLPIALVEAMASSVACVATAVNGVPELVIHEETGLLVPPGDVEALAAALFALVRSADQRRELGEAGHRHVLAHYTAVVSAERLATRLLARRSPRMRAGHGNEYVAGHPSREANCGVENLRPAADTLRTSVNSCRPLC